MMKIYEMIFSPTGGTRKVADIISKKLANTFSSENIIIDLTDRRYDFSSCIFEKEDICIVAVPSYGGRVPETAVSRIGQMEGNGAKAILIAVYGNREFEDTLVELQDTLEEAGFIPIAGIGALAEHSIVRQYAEGRPDEEDKKDLEEYAKVISQRLENKNFPEELILPGNRPYKQYNGVPIKPKASSACTKCGVCFDVCPVGAIPKEHPQDTDTDKCISCMRCLSVCPSHARGVNKVMLAASAKMLKKACSIPKKNELFL